MNITIKDLKPISCDCAKGVNMCKTRPCWGTPEEIAAIEKAGLGHRLMKDWWEGANRTYFLAPAIRGFEGILAPTVPRGRCTFLTMDDKCELHDKGLKPMEGRVACCNNEIDGATVHRLVAETWLPSRG